MVKKVSIIMAVRNSEKYISQAIESVILQSYKNFELIIIDDYSSDSSYEIINEFKKKDSRIKVYRNLKKLGPADTRNRAIKIARGEWISIIDSDDIFFPNKIEKQLKLVNKNKDLIFVGSNLIFIDHKGTHLAYYKYTNNSKTLKKKVVRNKSFPPHSSYFVKKKYLLKIGGYNKRFLMAPDYDLLLRLESFKNKEFGVCEEVLTKVRIHKGNRSHKKLNNFTQLDFAITASTCIEILKKFKIDPSRDFNDKNWIEFMNIFKKFISSINYYKFLVDKIRFKKNKQVGEYINYFLNINFFKSNFTGHILPKKFQEDFFKIFEKKFIKKNSNLRN
ncbi:glycosyltransferase [Candidatus Pelagibacter sp.]|nr:glycosyltransferase [Candidatus Pelagibacter sp.]